MTWKLYRNRRTGMAAVAVAGVLIVLASVVALEQAGTALTGSYSGLGGKLGPAKEGAPSQTAPAATPQR